MGSSLDDDYGVTCDATRVAWYSPCLILNRGGESGNSYGGCKGWVVGWVGERGFCGCDFLNGMLLGYLDEILL